MPSSSPPPYIYDGSGLRRGSKQKFRKVTRPPPLPPKNIKNKRLELSWNRSSHIIQVPTGITVTEFLFQRKKYYNIYSIRNKWSRIFVPPGINIIIICIIKFPEKQML